MVAAITPDMLATDLADYLVRKGVPFRETHHISGRVVARAEEMRIPMDKLTAQDLAAIDSRLGTDFQFDHEQSIELRTAAGGTSKASVMQQLQYLRNQIS